MTSLTITTGARLHFGLLDVRAPFGGCGLMVQSPATRIIVRRADRFQSDGDHDERIRWIADRWSTLLRSKHLPPVAVTVEASASPHCGLGSGTQLSMAVAEGILTVLEPDGLISRNRIMDLAGRGQRSMVGTHGYFDGGFVAEGIAATASTIDDPAADFQMPLPSQWRVVVFTPEPTEIVETVSGIAENEYFSRLPVVAQQTREHLIGLLRSELIRSIREADFERFAMGVETYNRTSGELFAAVQGGPYRSESARQIDRLRSLGCVGCGQSSWGPGVFAWFPSHTAASERVDALHQPGWEAKITAPFGGRVVQIQN